MGPHAHPTLRVGSTTAVAQLLSQQVGWLVASFKQGRQGSCRLVNKEGRVAVGL